MPYTEKKATRENRTHIGKRCVHRTIVFSSAQPRHVTFHPCRSGILKDFHGLSSMTGAGMVLAPCSEEEGWAEGLGVPAVALSHAQSRGLPGALMHG
jgi:hypothetical protein